ncbi:MAG: flagellar basal body rod protein FlgC [Gammaproteobacteria bacterium]|jgi:flagellar basal-body rod protein FlgC|nr:flagellar basal body rod protein FlgC [Gammaproteobacteria bacterium]
MSLLNIFDVTGSAMAAQTVRMNTTASNLANAETTASSAAEAYRARNPVFETVFRSAFDESNAGVRVTDIVANQAEPQRVYKPGDAMADADGYVYLSNVNVVDELVNMISASRSYQSSVEVLNTSKELLMRTLSLGQ